MTTPLRKFNNNSDKIAAIKRRTAGKSGGLGFLSAQDALRLMKIKAEQPTSIDAEGGEVDTELG